MLAYLIEPYAEELVKVVEYDDSLDGMYKLIGCGCVDAVTFNKYGDAVFVDDEGLLYSKEEILDRGFFILVHESGYIQTLAGKGLILGVNKEGDSTSPKESDSAIRNRIGRVERWQAERIVNSGSNR